MTEPSFTPLDRELTAAERVRYSRHLLLPEVGDQGQRRLLAARVLLVGLGGLGSPATLYLAAAGVGTIGVVDFDRVDATNLQRQILYAESDVGRSKVEAAADRLFALNPTIEIVRHEGRLTAANAMPLIEGYDVVLDGTDSFTVRYLVNDACALSGKPNVHGAIYRFDGQTTVFWPPRGPCYRCLFPSPPPAEAAPNCAEAGVLGVLPGVVGCLQATEAVKLLLGVGEPLVGRLLLYDALAARFREVRVARDPACPLCGDAPRIFTVEEQPADTVCGSATTGLTNGKENDMAAVADILPEELHQRMQAGEEIYILDVRQPDEHAAARIPGAKLIPLGDLPARLNELDPEQEIVVHCRMGGRASQAIAFLRQQGFSNVRNLSGGIFAWAEKVDPSMKPT